MRIEPELIEAYESFHRHPVNRALHALGTPLIGGSLVVWVWRPWLALALFAGGWGLQFIGHAIEGKSPRFWHEPRYLIVGPVLLMRRLRGVRFAAAPHGEAPRS